MIPKHGEKVVLLTALRVDKDKEPDIHKVPYPDMMTAVLGLISALQSMVDSGEAVDDAYMRFELIEGVSKLIPADQYDAERAKGETRLIGIVPKARH